MKWEVISKTHSIAFNKKRKEWQLYYRLYNKISPTTFRTRESLIAYLKERRRRLQIKRELKKIRQDYEYIEDEASRLEW
jgi:hypothetical protein